jgi:protein SCO1/2
VAWVVGWCLLAGSVAQAASPPSFELSNWDGRRVSTDSLKGTRTILAFTYAKCIDSCPMLTFQLKSLDDDLGSPADINYVHVSVNPSQDTPEEIVQHFAKHDIDPRRDPRWVFLAGDENAVAAVLEDYGIEVTRTPIEGGDRIEHTIKVLVINAAGETVVTFDSYHWDEKRMKNALGS